MLPPSPPLPSLIQTGLWGSIPLETLRACHRRYGDTFRLRMIGARDLVFVTTPEAVREIFTGDPDVLQAGEANRIILESFVGPRSILILDGKAHLRERKLLLPPFHGERMQAYTEKIRSAAAASIERWPIARPFAVLPHLQNITLKVILRAVFGVEEGERLTGLQATIARLLDGASAPWRMIPVLFGLNLFELLPKHPLSRLKADMDRSVREVIAERRGRPGNDILSLLLSAKDEHGNGLTDDDLRDELVTLLVAGYETTAIALSWALQNILASPATHAGILDELEADRSDLLDAAIKESLRLRPVVSTIARRLAAPARIAGYDLPAGVTVAPSIYLIHRRPDLYPEPERFLPERFLGVKPDPHAWLPFGGGTRRCLGMAFALYEMRILLTEIFGAVKLALPPGGPARVMRRGITLAPEGGGPIVVTAPATRSRTPRAAPAAS